MKNLSLHPAALLVLAVSGLYLGLASAGDKTASIQVETFKEAYVWYDGKQERKVWLNPNLVAEFYGSKNTAAKSAVKKVYADAVLVPMRRSGSVRLWSLQSSVTSEAAVRALTAVGPTGSYSPVLHDGPNATGRKRALPGNIIVYLNPGWDAAAINSWLSQHKLEIVKKLEIGRNIYVIKTGPGLEALTTANALHQSGDVVAAFPDWWQEVTTR